MPFSDLRARFEHPKSSITIETGEGVFENIPSPSTANYRCDTVASDTKEVSASFENTPLPSPAFTSYSRAFHLADGPHPSVFESDPVMSRSDFRA